MSDKRYWDIETQAEAFAEGEVSEDVQLTAEETKIIEGELTEQGFDDLHGWEIASHSVEAPDGHTIMFEAEIGDAGECCGIYGPYEIRDGKGALTADLYCGEPY